jgi:hypothetical protein
MTVTLPGLAITAILFLLGASVALFASWYAKHDLPDASCPKDRR